MSRGVSGLLVVIYWVLLIFFGLGAASMTLSVATGEVTSENMPVWGILAFLYGVPLVIGWRLSVISRARRIAWLAENFGTEKNDV